MGKGGKRSRAVEQRQVFGSFPGLQSELCDGVSVPGSGSKPHLRQVPSAQELWAAEQDKCVQNIPMARSKRQKGDLISFFTWKISELMSFFLRKISLQEF